MNNYNILYLLRRPSNTNNLKQQMFGLPENAKDFFWTMTTNDSVSEEKKLSMQRAYLGITLDLLDKIVCKDRIECKALQESVNYVFKPWITKTCRISIDMTNDEFINIVKRIYSNESMQAISNELICKYKHPIESGTIYLVKCANNKVKIGKTAKSINKRLEELKVEERNQATEILDTFESTDTALDEANLHLQCSDYKADSNKPIRWLQDHGNSELFHNRQEVIDIWNKYKEGK